MSFRLIVNSVAFAGFLDFYLRFFHASAGGPLPFYVDRAVTGCVHLLNAPGLPDVQVKQKAAVDSPGVGAGLELKLGS
jgi:hypothetical protein